MAGPLVIGIPLNLQNLVQDRTLERVFRDALYPKLLFRAEAAAELWPVNLGDNQTFTRAGLLAPSKTPLVAGVDPTPKSVAIEQWEATAKQYGDTIDTHMPTSTVAAASLFLRNSQQLGLGGGQSLNQLARDPLFKAYIGGHTVNDVAIAAPTNNIHVAALNGFRFVLVNGRPTTVSTTNSLSVIIATVGTRNVTAVAPDDVTDPDGPGIITVDGAAIAALALRESIRSSIRSTLVYSGGGTNVDDVSAVDILTLQDLISAVARLRLMNVPPFPDGFYHVHLDPTSEAQIFADPAFQRLNTSLPDYLHYREAALGHLLGMMFYRNAENPLLANSGATVSTGGLALYSRDIGGDTVNETGIPLHRAIVLGQGTIYEKYLDESKYITEAGVMGKIGSFDIVNNGLAVMIERIRYILRAPMDRLQQVVGQTWSWSGDFAIPSDITSGDAARFKRAVVVIHGE
jgi:hypothetical protein